MAHRIAHRNEIGHGVRDRQRLGLALRQHHPGGKHPAGLGQHPGARLDAVDRAGLADNLGGGAGHLAGAGRDVHDGHAGPQARELQDMPAIPRA